jgi:hypothetical protein
VVAVSFPGQQDGRLHPDRPHEARGRLNDHGLSLESRVEPIARSGKLTQV